MNGRSVSRPMIFFFLLALVLIVWGMVMLFGVFRDYETIALHHTEQELLSLLRISAVKLVTGGGMVVAGIGTLVITVLHLIRRTARVEKEADALRQKNQAMEALNEQTRQLAHHQRLETIGTLTSSIAHEFNNLLTPIMGYSLMALEKLPPEEEELYDDILEIYSASQKAKDIISRLSDLSRKNSDTTFRPVSPDDTVRKTLDVANPARPKNVEVRVDLNCWDQRLLANEIQLSQLLLNLILNGFHAMEAEGGILTITTAFDEKDIRIRVSDTGCGIPADVLPRIFEPFFTTKETGRGTGLGLAIAAQMVEDHHGEIKVDSQVGQGTTFTVRLPRS